MPRGRKLSAKQIEQADDIKTLEQLKRFHPMSWIDIIDYAFSLYRRHFRSILCIVSLYVVVDVLRECVFLLLLEYNSYHILDDIINSLLMALGIGVLIVHLREIYFGRQIALREVLQRFRSIFFLYFESSFVYLIPSSLWKLFSEMNKYPNPKLSVLLLLGLPFVVYFSIAWTLYGPIVILDRSVSHHPLTLSRYLVRGAWWRVCGTLIGVIVIILFVQLVFSFFYMFIVALFGYGEGTLLDKVVSIPPEFFASLGADNVKQFSLSHAISSLYGVVVHAITLPIYVISVILIYYNRQVADDPIL